MIGGLVVGQSPTAVRYDQIVQTRDAAKKEKLFMEIASVVAAGESDVQVLVAGQMRTASRATDEPVYANDRVWVTETDEQILLMLGKVK